MIKVVAHFYIKPENLDDAKPIFNELVENSRASVGNISYKLFTTKNVPNHFTFIEEWKDGSAMNAHITDKNFIRLMAALTKLQEKAPEIITLEPYL